VELGIIDKKVKMNNLVGWRIEESGGCPVLGVAVIFAIGYKLKRGEGIVMRALQNKVVDRDTVCTS
jgi:hypothetical protein